MAKFPKELITVTPLSITLSVICFVFFMFLAFYLGTQYQRLKVLEEQQLKNAQLSAVTQQQLPQNDNTDEQTIDNFLTYQIPQGWKKIETKYDAVSIESPDFKFSTYTPDQGARIWFPNKGIATSKSLETYILDEKIPPPDATNVSKDTITVSNKTFIRQFYCYEGCHETYFFTEDDKVWNFTLSCGPGCTSQTVFTKRYGVTMNTFLKSFNFTSEKDG